MRHLTQTPVQNHLIGFCSITILAKWKGHLIEATIEEFAAMETITIFASL